MFYSSRRIIINKMQKFHITFVDKTPVLVLIYGLLQGNIHVIIEIRSLNYNFKKSYAALNSNGIYAPIAIQVLNKCSFVCALRICDLLCCHCRTLKMQLNLFSLWLDRRNGIGIMCQSQKNYRKKNTKRINEWNVPLDCASCKIDSADIGIESSLLALDPFGSQWISR